MISKLHLRRSGRAILLAIAPVAAMWFASVATAQQVPVSGGPVDPQFGRAWEAWKRKAMEKH